MTVTFFDVINWLREFKCAVRAVAGYDSETAGAATLLDCGATCRRAGSQTEVTQDRLLPLTHEIISKM